MTAAETTTTTALPKKAGLVDLDRTRERLTKLGLVHAAETLSAHVGTAVKVGRSVDTSERSFVVWLARRRARSRKAI